MLFMHSRARMQKLKDFPAEVEFSSPVLNPGLLNNLGL